MAIHTPSSAPQSPHPASQAQPIDIEAWTEQATAAMGSVTISSDPIQGTTISLHIPLDEHAAPRPIGTNAASGAIRDGYYKRKEPMRRDSMKRREALLKGKEGTRRRQRWENDHLLNNPYAEPPQPRDWEIHPTHPVHNVPYYLAPLWDAGLAARSAERKAKVAASKPKSSAQQKGADPHRGVVPKELREKMKRARGAKPLLMDLENEVRKFMQRWEEQERKAEQEGVPMDVDSEDDEIVFVGRNGGMSDFQSLRSGGGAQKEMMIFDSLEEDQGAGFGRWLVHHIGTYYGLRTWSITVGNPARREAYIGLKDTKLKAGRRHPATYSPLPRPLWVIV
jgi:hypothetical protein